MKNSIKSYKEVNNLTKQQAATVRGGSETMRTQSEIQKLYADLNTKIWQNRQES